jgi:hypothetical protein
VVIALAGEEKSRDHCSDDDDDDDNAPRMSFIKKTSKKEAMSSSSCAYVSPLRLPLRGLQPMPPLLCREGVAAFLGVLQAEGVSFATSGSAEEEEEKDGDGMEWRGAFEQLAEMLA